MPICADDDRHVPKKPVRPVTYSEDQNESPRGVEEEPVEIERENSRDGEYASRKRRAGRDARSGVLRRIAST